MAKPSRRVSLKGRGADIFFGEYTPPSAVEEGGAPGAPGASDEAAATVSGGAAGGGADGPPGRSPSSGQGGTEELTQGRSQERGHTSLTARKLADGGETGGRSRRRRDAPRERSLDLGGLPGSGSPLDVSGDVWINIERAATITNSFRYVESELEALTDVLYEIRKKTGVRVTRQDAARLGLNVILDDYRRRGPASLLWRLAGRRRRPPSE